MNAFKIEKPSDSKPFVMRWWHWTTAAVMGLLAAAAHAALNAHDEGGGFAAPLVRGEVVQYLSPLVLGVVAGFPASKRLHAVSRVMLMTLVSILIAVPAMGRQLICLITIIPFCVGAGAVVALISSIIVSSTMRPGPTLMLLWGGFFAWSLPSEVERAAVPFETVSDRIEVSADRETVWASIERLHLPLRSEFPWWHRVLLPEATAIDGGGAHVGAIRRVTFNNGTIDARVVESNFPARFAFELDVRATGPEFFDHFADLKRSEFTFEPTASGGTVITHSTRYQPRAFPRWYFGPIEQTLGSYLQASLLKAYARHYGPPLTVAQK